MSTSPAKAFSAPTSAAPAPAMRKKAPVSVFNPKKKQIKKPLPANAYTAGGQVPANSARLTGPPSQARPATNRTQAAPTPDDDPSTFNEYSIVVEKSALTRGLHYHGFRLQSRLDQEGKLEQINPYDEQQFTRPVKLYRRRAQDKPEMTEQSDAASGVDDKERELREAKRAERQAEKEANQALIAPTGEAAKKSMKKKPQKKVEDVYWDDSNPKNIARSQLRYEEARPWHLEDFDNKNKWVGSFEAPLSQKHVMFEIGQHGFKMVPVEKWYRMIRTDRVTALDDAQVEKMMTAKTAAPRWFMNKEELAKAAEQAAIEAHRAKLEQSKKSKKEELDDDDDVPAFVKQEEYRADVDEIDFEFNDEFQDDDEGAFFGDQGDDDQKDIERRIREEMRSANLPDAGVKGADDQDWIDEEKKQKDAEEEERKKQKRIRKQLKKKELRHEYESDDEGNIYMDSSDSEDSEEERERQEEERKKEEAQKAAQANGDRSGSSTKGSNTPTGRPEKKALKRDADVSDLSGNESSRNRKKAKLNGTASSLGGARALSPDAAKRIPSGYGSGSDTDTSRPGRTKLKLKNSPSGSPHDGSRAGSPNGSRAQSPARAPAPPPPGPFPTADEVKAAIPPEGVPIGELVKMFKPRVLGRTTEFIALVKEAGRQDPATKWIVLK